MAVCLRRGAEDSERGCEFPKVYWLVRASWRFLRSFATSITGCKWLTLGNTQHPVLLTEPPLNPRTNRDTAAQILFETFNVPALYTSIQAVLSLYASGRTTGVVLDAGDGVSHAVPVYGGFQINNAVQRIDVAGRDVTEHLQMLLRKSGYVFHTSAEKEIVRNIKESHSYVCLDPVKEEKEWSGSTARANEKSVEYKLPDGKKLKVSSNAAFFPSLLTSEIRSAPNVSGLLRSCSTRSLLDRSTKVSTSSSSTRSTGPISTCARTCLEALCSRAAPL